MSGVNAAAAPAPETRWISLPAHRRWLLQQADGLFAFFERGSLDPQGGFFTLDDGGDPIRRNAAGHAPAREIHVTARTVHCFSVGRLMGRPGADRFIDQGMDFLWSGHRDATHGGYAWAVGKDGPGDSRKQAYGHAFVLLAGASAKVAGHPDADRLIADVTEVLRTRFWEAEHGAVAEEFEADWRPFSRYRGQNSNMHLTEATMAAFEATGDRTYLDMTESIATLIIDQHARAGGWRVWEHFDENWGLDRDKSDGDVFRPYGTTPGHWLEWARLLVQLWELGGRRLGWLPEAAKALFARSVTEGWNAAEGGFHYTIDWDGAPRLRHRLWWPAAEGVGAAHALAEIDADPFHERWYRTIWDFIARDLIDRKHGAWRTEAAGTEGVGAALFTGKPDLYHALQACLIPLLPAAGSITRGLARGALT